MDCIASDIASNIIFFNKKGKITDVKLNKKRSNIDPSGTTPCSKSIKSLKESFTLDLRFAKVMLLIRTTQVLVFHVFFKKDPHLNGIDNFSGEIFDERLKQEKLAISNDLNTVKQLATKNEEKIEKLQTFDSTLFYR